MKKRTRFIVASIVLASFVVIGRMTEEEKRMTPAEYDSKCEELYNRIVNAEDTVGLIALYAEADSLIAKMKTDKVVTDTLWGYENLRIVLTDRANRLLDVAKREKTQKLFSQYDGSCYVVERAIKESMNDEESYKHIKTAYIVRDSTVMVETVFSGKNGFGGVVKERVLAEVSLDGVLMSIKRE